MVDSVIFYFKKREKQSFWASSLIYDLDE